VQSFANPLSYWVLRIPRPPILSSHLFTFSKTRVHDTVCREDLATTWVVAKFAIGRASYGAGSQFTTGGTAENSFGMGLRREGKVC